MSLKNCLKFSIYKENYDDNHFGYSQTLNDLALDHFKVGNYF